MPIYIPGYHNHAACKHHFELKKKKKKVKTHYSVTMINKVLASPVCNYIAFCASEKNSSFFGAWR